MRVTCQSTKRYTKLIQSSAFVLGLLSPIAAQAQWTVSSEFKLRIPSAALDQVAAKAVSGFSSQQTLHWNSLQVSAQNFPITITGIDAQLNFALSSSVLQSGSLWDVSSRDLQAKVDIANISVNSVIDQVIDGVRVHTVLQAQCSGIELNLAPSSASLSAQVSAGMKAGNLALSLDSISTQIQPGNWQVSIASCQGPSGIETVVANGLAQALSSGPDLMAKLKDSLQTQLESVNQGLVSLMQPHPISLGSSHVSSSLLPESLTREASGQLLVSGHLKSVFAVPTTPARSVIVTFDASEGIGLPSDQATFVVPSALMQSLIEASGAAGILSYATEAAKLPGFSNLMNSWLIKLFIWPDLMRYNSSTPFYMQLWAGAAPTLSWTTGMNANLSTTVNALLWVSEKGTYQRYVSWSGPSISQLGFSLSGSTVTMQVKGVSELKIKSTFDADYVRMYNPDTYIADSTIGGQLKKALQTQKLVWTFPSIDFGSSIHLRPTSLNRLGSEIVLPIGLVP